jgi:nucleotide-binding universal stress UspA family protein
MFTPKILFPVTFTDACSAMAAYVERAASLFNAKVVLLHVVDPQELDLLEGFALYLRPGFELKAEHIANRTAALAQYLTDTFPIASSERIVLSGDPSMEIAKYSAHNDIKVVIMPTHASRFRETLLGSTTARVIDSALCPVLTGVHAEKFAPHPLSHRRWICALARTPQSRVVLQTAKHYADDARATLSIIHILETSDVEKSEEPIPLAALQGASDWLVELIGDNAPGVPFEIVLGDTRASLQTALRSADADILIVGRTPTQNHTGRMADLTYALVRDSPFPVLSV